MVEIDIIQVKRWSSESPVASKFPNAPQAYDHEGPLQF